MKKCSRCGSIADNNEQFCPKCGGTKFSAVSTQSQVKPSINKPQQPIRNNTSGQQNVNRPQTTNQRVNNTQQVARNNANMSNRQGNTNIDISNVKLTKKQEQSKDLAMMNAMKQAQMKGVNFDAVAFERNWIVNNVLAVRNKNNSSEDTVSLVQWLIILAISTIPLVGIVYSVIGMKNCNYSETRRNFHKAFLAFYVAVFILSIILTSVINRM